MREILFRGKHYRTGEWVYGVFFRNPAFGLDESAYYPEIIPEINGLHSTVHSCTVIEETVGEFTGYTDKNGVKIFEGDIVKHETPGWSAKYGVINFGKYAIDTDNPEYNIGFYISWLNNPFVRQDLGFWLEQREIVIIGNIHDNPELVGGAK